MAGPRKGKGGKKKPVTKKRKSGRTWDDDVPAAAGRRGAGDANGDENSRDAKRRRAEREHARGSMFSQWKQKKQAVRNREKQFVSRAGERKREQHEQYLTQRMKRANAAYGGGAEQREGREEMEPAANSEYSEDGEDSEDSEAEDQARKWRRGSVFAQFVQTFRPSVEEEDAEEEEEEEGEDEYEEIEVDEDGNPVEDEEEEVEEDMVEIEEVDEDEEALELPLPEEEDDDDDETEAAAAQDPFRQRYLLSTFTEEDAKRMTTAKRSFRSVSQPSAAVPAAVLDEFRVSYKPGVPTAEEAGGTKMGEEKEETLAWVPTEPHVRARLQRAWQQRGVLPASSSLEAALFRQLSSYTDVLFAGQTLALTPSLRRVSAMHVLNHVLKARDTVVRNNERLRKREEVSAEATSAAATDADEREYRDQGFARPTVLVLLPLRSSAAAFVRELLALLPPTLTVLHHKDRFEAEYGSVDGKAADVSGTSKDEEGAKEGEEEGEGNEDGGQAADPSELKEWQRVFAEGNNDDAFQIGLSLSRRALTFYSDYRRADIILASPLALRAQLGDEVVDVETTQSLSSAFLSSIEVCVVDSGSLLLMQNLEHLRLVLRACNAKPTQAPDADFARLRDWNLSFLGAFFRQTIVFAHGLEPALQHVVHKLCCNQRGLLKYVRRYDDGGPAHSSLASIGHVVPQVKQIFQRIDQDHHPHESHDHDTTTIKRQSLGAAEEVELRFAYFQKHIFAPLLDTPRKHVLLVVPSYFDYVRIRNLFHDRVNQRLIRAVQCCEYTTAPQLSRARTAFFHGKAHVMLVTERFHFYHQYQLRGVHQIIWYAPPAMGTFYPEFLNMLAPDVDAETEAETELADRSSIALFTRLDRLRLQRIVGEKRTERMCHPRAKKATFLFC